MKERYKWVIQEDALMALRTFMDKHPKTGVYRFRKGVPAELRPFLPAPHSGKREIIQSYGTKDPREAARIHMEVSPGLEALFDQARSAMAANPNGVSSEAAARHAPTAYEKTLAAMLNETDDFSLALDPAILPPGLRQLVPSAAGAESVSLSTLTGEVSPEPHRHSINAVFAEYEREKNLSADIANDFRRSWQIFCEITGGTMDSPITKVTKADVRAFKLALRDLPAGATKIELRGKTAPEMIEIARETNMKRIADGTLNKHIAALSAVLKFAQDIDYRSDDPTLRMALKAPRKKVRRPYGMDDLKAIFGSKLFREHPWDERQWLPVLALYTGCRLEELGQLLVSDVKREDGVWYLAIQEADDEGNIVKSLKTESSTRDVPLHHCLIDLGFLDYKAEMERSCQRHIFPNLRERNGVRTVYFSKWYGRQRNTFGITDRRKVFHSFRHSFKDACRDADVPEDVRDALTGHANGSVGRDYGRGHSRAKLAMWIRKISYDVEIPKPTIK